MLAGGGRGMELPNAASTTTDDADYEKNVENAVSQIASGTSRVVSEITSKEAHSSEESATEEDIRQENPQNW